MSAVMTFCQPEIKLKKINPSRLQEKEQIFFVKFRKHILSKYAKPDNCFSFFAVWMMKKSVFFCSFAVLCVCLSEDLGVDKRGKQLVLFFLFFQFSIGPSCMTAAIVQCLHQGVGQFEKSWLTAIGRSISFVYFAATRYALLYASALLYLSLSLSLSLVHLYPV